MRLARAGFVGEFVGFVLARAFRFSGEEEGAGGEAVVRLEFCGSAAQHFGQHFGGRERPQHCS